MSNRKTGADDNAATAAARELPRLTQAHDAAKAELDEIDATLSALREKLAAARQARIEFEADEAPRLKVEPRFVKRRQLEAAFETAESEIEAASDRRRDAYAHLREAEAALAPVQRTAGAPDDLARASADIMRLKKAGKASQSDRAKLEAQRDLLSVKHAELLARQTTEEAAVVTAMAAGKPADSTAAQRIATDVRLTAQALAALERQFSELDTQVANHAEEMRDAQERWKSARESVAETELHDAVKSIEGVLARHAALSGVRSVEIAVGEDAIALAREELQREVA